MDYIYKLKSTVTGVLPGNAVTRDFDVIKHVASAGPGLLWKVYDGVKKSTKEEASVFVFEKKTIERYSKRDKDIIIEMLKSGVQKMTRLRHPKILSVLHPLEESRDSLAFATERVFASVANMLGFCDNMPTNPANIAITECKLYDVEIKYGLLQVVEGLTFLHNDAKIMHGNICPESIVIARNGAWKLAGFDFTRSNSGSETQIHRGQNGCHDPRFQFPQYDCTPWMADIPHVAQPKLDYLAPEHVMAGACSRASDMFAYGMFIHAVFSMGKPALTACNDISNYKRNVSQLSSVNLSSLPEDLQQTVRMLLNSEPAIRPDADQTSKIPFFEDVGVNTLLYLDTLIQRDNLQKSQFFKGLPQIIPKLPKRVHLQRMLPCMVAEFVNHSMIPFVLPSVIIISESLTQAEYCQHVLPSLVPVFKIQHPIQILLICLQNMDLFLKKTPSADVKNHILPLIYNALESDTPQIQVMCLTVVPTFADLIDYPTLKAHIFPRIKKLCLSTGLLNNAVRVQCLVCVGKLLEQMDKWFVLDEVLPSMGQVPSREPAVLMSILGIFQVAFSHPKLGITKEILASKVIPFLIPLAIDSNLNLQQFNAFIAVVKEMVNRVESEHRTKLEQLNSMQQEQRTIEFGPDPSRSSNPSQLVDDGSSDSMMDKFLSGFGITSMLKSSSSQQLQPGQSAGQQPGHAAQAGDTQNGLGDGVPKPDNKPTSLSMEEKLRLAKEQEQHKRYKSQSPLSPNNSTTASKSISPTSTHTAQIPARNNTPRDLTATLTSGHIMASKSVFQKPPGPALGQVNMGSSMGSGHGSMGGYGGAGMGAFRTGQMGGSMGSSTVPMGGSMGSMNSGMVGGGMMNSGMSSMNTGLGMNSQPMGNAPMGMSNFGSMGMQGSTMGSSSGMQPMSSMNNQQNFASWNSAPNQNTKSMDMSAFDSLLSMPSNKPSPSLNQMGQAPQSEWPAISNSNSSQNSKQQQKNDISDIFG